MKYSIIIPTFNHLDDCLKPCLESIIQHTDLQDVEVIVVANGCTDNTVKYVRSLGFKCSERVEPLGFTKATNEGIKAATGQYVVILNNDTQILGSNWLEMLERPFKEDSTVGITGAAKNYHEPTEHDFLLFFCVMLSRKTIEKIGLLDEIFNPGYGEDIDYCFKVRNAGMKVVQVPNDITLNSLRDIKDHTIQFPIWHKSSQTVHSVPGWVDIVNRNETRLLARYHKGVTFYEAGDSFDMISSYEITPKIDSITSTLKEGATVHFKLNDRAQVTLGTGGFIHGLFPGKENIDKLIQPRRTIEPTLEGIKEHMLACGSKGLAQFGGRWEGGYATQQDPDEITALLYDLKGHDIKDYLEIGAAEGGVTRLICEIANVRNVTHIDLGWGDMYHPYTYRQMIENIPIRGKMDIFRGDSTSQQAKDFLGKRKFDVIFIDGDHSYEGALKDTILAMEHATDGCLFVYHDHIAVEDVGRLFLELQMKKFPELTFEKEYVSDNQVTRKGISTFRYKDLSKPKISIVIPTYNHLEDCLIPCINSIEKYTTLDNVEIIVVANGCTDETHEFLIRKPVKWIETKEPLGFIKATNLGITMAKGEFVVLLNNDTELLPQEKDTWINMLLEPFKDSKVGITGPYKDWRFFWEQDRLVFREDYMVFYCAMIRRSLIDSIGLLDEDFGLGYEEDIDFAVRAKKAGCKIVQVPEDLRDELNITKEFLLYYKNRNDDFPLIHKDSMTFKDIPKSTNTSLLLSKWNQKPTYSIIIPTYNHLEDLLKPCIGSIIQNTQLEDVEVIIVANGCTDDTREYVHSLGHPFKLFWIDEQVGYIKATNAGIKQAMGDYIVLLNNDVQIQGESWIYTLRDKAHHAGLAGVVKSHRDDVKRDYLLFWCVMIKREVFDKIGLLDEQFGLGYHEDVDFCMRAENAGYELAESNIAIYHRGGGTFEPIYGNSPQRLDEHKQKLYDKIKPVLPAGWFGYGDQDFHRELISQIPEGGKMIEVGVWKGLSLCSAAELIKSKNISILAVDTFKGSPWEGEQGCMVKEDENMEQEFNRNMTAFKIRDKVYTCPIDSLEAAKTIEDKSIDLIFLDADHRYESVLSEIKAWLPKLKPTGLISGHDYMWGEGVRAAVDGIFGEENVFNVDNIWYVIPENWKKAKLDYNAPLQKRDDLEYGKKNVEALISDLKANNPVVANATRRVYDCFTFFNELDVLEIRLNELNDVVDKFVLCEARYTHQGQPKPLYFDENKQRFSKFLHKIEHLIINSFPEGLHSPNGMTTWDREHYQRSYIIKGLKDAKDNDIIILSDADEILKADTVRSYRPEMGITQVEMSLFYYKLDWKLEEKWYKPRIFTFSSTKTKSIQDFRGGADYEYSTRIVDGGWHFSFLGDKDSIKYKIQSYAHDEFNTESITSDQNITDAIEQGRDVFGRILHFNKVYIDDSYPKYVRENIGYYIYKGLVSKPTMNKNFIDQCISNAEAGVSRMDKGVFNAMSMLNERTRHLFNNLGMFGGNYLEVGTWHGGSVCSLLSNNKVNATVIDDFSEFLPTPTETWIGDKHPREMLDKHLKAYGSGNDVKVIEGDFYSTDVKALEPADIYFYDGGHDYDSQHKALRYALPALADTFLFIVDDYHWPEVNDGTKNGIQELISEGKIECIHQRELLSFTPPQHIWPDGWQRGLTNLIGEWRNGVYVGLFRKLSETSKPKVYDCFSFFNELDLLEIRLEEMYPHVDYFVISEMAQTHSGLPKLFNYEEHKQSFSKYKDKIIYLNPPNIETNDPWTREHYQRDYIKTYLETVCKNDDWIIVSDLDEIPRGEKIKEYSGKGIRWFEQNQYSYYLNYNVGISSLHPGTFSRITNWGYIKRNNLSLTGLRYLVLTEDMVIKDGGWHFSWMGGAYNIHRKLQSWAHQEFNTPEYKKPIKHIEQLISEGKEHFGREGVGETTPVEIDSTFPKYVQDNRESLFEKNLLTYYIPAEKPKVAIIMPYYNDPFLTKSVAAIMGQTFKNWELFIVDDGSDFDKRAANILASHPQIHIFEIKNSGPSAARNHALKHIFDERYLGIHNKFHPHDTHIAFCDSDDIWNPNYLTHQLKAIRDADVVYCSVNEVFDNGQIAYSWGIPDPPDYPGREVMLQTPFIYISGVVCKRNCLENIRFDSRLDSIEDWDMWLQLDGLGYKFKKNHRKLLTYTVKTNPSMAGQRTQEKTELLKEKHESVTAIS